MFNEKYDSSWGNSTIQLGLKGIIGKDNKRNKNIKCIYNFILKMSMDTFMVNI